MVQVHWSPSVEVHDEKHLSTQVQKLSIHSVVTYTWLLSEIKYFWSEKMAYVCSLLLRGHFNEH